MTLSIIFGTIVVMGIGLLIWETIVKDYSWKSIIGYCFVTIAGISFVVNILCWLPSSKDSEISYNQLISEKATIEAMLETDKDVDRFLLNSAVIDYNNRIIKYRTNCKRFVLKDYYNQNLDWENLELIEWK